MNNVSNFYELLGVQPDASTEDIQKAYRKKAKQHHPDKNNGSEASTEMFKKLGEAKDCLTDPHKRLAYDYSVGVKKRPQPRPQFQQTPPPPPPRPQPQTGPGFPTGVAIGVGIGALVVGIALAYFFSDDDYDDYEDDVD
jgi:DnaJ-class molecular chaperone